MELCNQICARLDMLPTEDRRHCQPTASQQASPAVTGCISLSPCHMHGVSVYEKHNKRENSLLQAAITGCEMHGVPFEGNNFTKFV